MFLIRKNKNTSPVIITLNNNLKEKMKLSKENLKEYQKIHKAKYWTDISEKEALKQWMALINLMKTVIHNNFDYGN